MGRSRRRSMGRWCQLLSAPDHHQSWCGHWFHTVRVWPERRLSLVREAWD
jgi:hypothetical protein